MRIRVFENEEQAGVYAAGIVEQVILQEDNPVLGLATGNSVIPLYNQLARFSNQGLNWEKVLTVNLDEYIGLGPCHPQSYHSFMWQHLFRHTNVLADNVHIPIGTASDLDEECKRYDAILSRNDIHLQVLGIGLNGHIGFNEPDDLLISNTHVVELSSQTISRNRHFFNKLLDVPRRAITVGVQSILQAKHILLLAFGEEKAAIIKRTLEGEVRTDLPASILQLHQNVTLVLDRESSAGLSEARKGL